jgi:hypothetical protein
MGKIERPPGWILKYKERIENEEITVDEILEEENRTREVPIKISSVTRAINAMGLPITGLRSRSEGGVKEGKAEGSLETSRKSERIERGPGWLQKYREKIMEGTITIEDILEEENRIRTEQIKIATVKRAVNAMGYPITGMRDEREEAAREGEAKETVEKGVAAMDAEKGPGWLQKYRERIEKGKLTVDQILEEENKIREVPIKRSSVTRAVNAMGYPITEMRDEREEAARGGEQPKEAGKAETVVYSSSIGKLSESTAKRFNAMKKGWEEDLGKSLQNDYFVNLLLALAKLAEHSKTLAPVKK